MRVDLVLFDGAILLDRGVLLIGPSETIDSFSCFRITHRLGTDAADVVLSDFVSPIRLTNVKLDMPIHESSDWESIKLNFDNYIIAFWCRLDA